MTVLNEVVVSVLPVLKNMRKCIEIGDTYLCADQSFTAGNFNLHTRFGICWHLFAHCPGVDSIYYLSPVFVELGYNKSIPVEYFVQDQHGIDAVEYMKSEAGIYENRYDPDSIHGAVRIKLLDELIEYFERA